MSNANYELLGLDESASDEEIAARYKELKAKYNEDRGLEGEAGNEAARMLGKLDAAYNEIMAERKDRERSGAGTLDEVAADIRNGDLVGAQAKLDACNDRGGEWHYLQSVLFFRKNWMNESKKQLEIAMQLDPSNTKYKDAYDRINSRMNYHGQNAGNGAGGNDTAYDNPQTADPQMGGSGCAQCVDFCYTCLCVNCLFQLCCNCR